MLLVVATGSARDLKGPWYRSPALGNIGCHVYLQMRDILGVLYTDAQFADLFATRGQPAETP
jgi:hypothetical protein